jgi:ribosomal protein S3
MLNNRNKKIEISEIKILEKILEKIYLTTAKGLVNNNVDGYSFINIEIVEIKKPYINSEILGKYIIINLKKYTLKKIWRILEIGINPINKNILTYNYNNLKYSALGKVIQSYIIGIKIIINGRLMKRKTASRSKKIVLTYGKLKINSLSSLIDITSSETILNSKIGIKVLISNIIKLN